VCSPLAGDHHDGGEDHEAAREREPQRARGDACKRDSRHLQPTMHRSRTRVKRSRPVQRPPPRLANVGTVGQTGSRPIVASTRRRPGDEARGTDVLRAFFVDRRAGERMKPGNRVDAAATGVKAPSLDAADNERLQVARHRVRRAHQYALVGLPLRHRRLAAQAETLCPSPTRGSPA